MLCVGESAATDSIFVVILEFRWPTVYFNFYSYLNLVYLLVLFIWELHLCCLTLQSKVTGHLKCNFFFFFH